MFKTDISLHKEAFQNDGFINLKDVLSDRFVDHMRKFLADILAERMADLEANRIANHKKQYLFEFPSRESALEFRDSLSALSGLNADKAILSERHLMVYDQVSKDYPYPHKDRAASGLTVGFPVDVPAETAIYIFPNMNRSENLNEKATYLGPDDYPDPRDIYKGSDAVRLDQEVGDMVVFMGSTLYHARVKPAGTAVLYCKMNDIGRDPLGENIFETTVSA